MRIIHLGIFVLHEVQDSVKLRCNLLGVLLVKELEVTIWVPTIPHLLLGVLFVEEVTIWVSAVSYLLRSVAFYFRQSSKPVKFLLEICVDLLPNSSKLANSRAHRPVKVRSTQGLSCFLCILGHDKSERLESLLLSLV